jgi:hypothetical protein
MSCRGVNATERVARVVAVARASRPGNGCFALRFRIPRPVRAERLNRSRLGLYIPGRGSSDGSLLRFLPPS